MDTAESLSRAPDITPLSAALGASVSGIDFTGPVDDDTARRIRAALLEHHLLCLRSVPLTPAAFLAVGKLFGEPQVQLLRKHRVDEAPGVSVFDSTWKAPEDKPADLRLDRRSGWHTDDSYFAEPAWITLLQALEIPSSGGETRFCNAQAAWEDLPAATRARIDGLSAVHAYDTFRAPARAVARSAAEAADTPDVVHPLVRTHEETGAKAIYFNSNRTDRIEGLPRDESDALLDELHEHMTQPRYRYDHRWTVGDILMWDNRSVIHSVNVDFPVGEPRVHQRILLKGTKPR